MRKKLADDEDILEGVFPGNTPFPSAVADNSNLFEVSFRKEIENVTTGSANIKVDGENTVNNIVCDEDSLHTFDLDLENSAEDKVPDNRAEVNSFEKQGEEKCSLLSDQDTLTSFKNEQGKNILTKDAGPVLVDNIKFSADETNERELNFTKKINLVIEDKNEFSSDGTDIRHRHFPISELEFDCESNANCPNVTPANFVTSELQTEKPLETSIASVDSGRVDSKKSDCGSTKATMERFSLFKFFMAEVTRGYHLEMEEDRYTEKRQKVYTFMRIPMEFEKLMIFGFMLCLDCFLYVFTYLPLRVIVALYKLTTGMLLWRRHLLEPVQKCDLLKAWILASCFVLLDYVDFGVIYHIVRGQSVIKLYVIYNMLDIADRLFSSFGQDILDALFWTATEPKDRRRDNLGILPHFVLAVIYVFLHSILVLFQATCLNVAVNSHSKALLVVMVSNQFVELKGSVFKRFEKNNLFQMSCSDIRERFHYLVLVSIVTLRNQTEFNWNRDNLYTILPYLVAVLSSEYLVDWLKHAFITKFNDIAVEVYSEYKLLLAQDATSSRQKNAHTDHFDLVSRRMGFIPLPLGVLVTKIVTQSFTLSGPTGVCLVVSTYIFLCSLKILNSIVFLGKACQYVNEKREKDAINANSAVKAMSKRSLNQQQKFGVQSSASFLDSNVSLSQSSADKEKMSDSISTSEKADKKKRTKKLEEIDRYTLCSNQIVL